MCDVKGHTLTRHQPPLGLCPENGFFGSPLRAHVEYGRTALVEGSARRDLSPGVDFKRWKAPKLLDEGRPFVPAKATNGVSLGGFVSRDEKDGRRSGQVWAACPKKPGAIWVAPDDGGSAVALCSKTLDVLA